MKVKRTLLLVLIIVSAACSAFASASYSPSAQCHAGGSFTFPTDAYMVTSPMGELPRVRTSFDVCTEAMVANFKINKVEVGAGFSWLYNTRSLAAGISVLRSYSGMGFSIGAQYHFDGIFSLGGKFRYLFCRYYPMKNCFDILEIEALPGFDFIENEKFETSLTVPVTFSLKPDSISVRVGVGFDIQYNLIFGGKNETSEN